MVQDELSSRYFEWMYHIVNGHRMYNNLSYRKLLKLLHEIPFQYILPMDENRAEDGISFRYEFGYNNGYSNGIIERYLDIKPCSVLEMMIALAFKVEEQITNDSDYGDRTGQWFWNMIVSLGLGYVSDNDFNERYVRNVIDRFLDRDYEPTGRGGLFTIENCNYDLRYMDIWSQFMWYLDDVISSHK